MLKSGRQRQLNCKKDAEKKIANELVWKSTRGYKIMGVNEVLFWKIAKLNVWSGKSETDMSTLTQDKEIWKDEKKQSEAQVLYGWIWPVSSR